MSETVKKWNLRYSELLFYKELTLLNAGFVERLRTWNAQNCISPFWVLWYNFSPGNRCVACNREYPLTPDKMILIPPNILYSGELGAVVSHFYIWFQTKSPFDYPRREIIEIPVEPFIERIESTLTGGPRQKFLLYTLVSEILAEIPEDFFNNKNASRCSMIIERALNLINHRDGCISNEELASELHLSTTRIAHLFKSEVGISPQRYCTQVKMYKAGHLLRAGHSIEIVAVSCGFADRYHFSKEFKRCYKVSPGRWQKDFCNRNGNLNENDPSPSMMS
ncbi:MAG: helix-turn-helix transcriptional regulator [Lentisphaeria bacterium]|nr:helix-turn-helix transcriptional regulator [Lentisphaeria bacterium]